MNDWQNRTKENWLLLNRTAKMIKNVSDYYLERLGPHDTDVALASIPLKIGANTIGRLPTNNIVLTSKYASRSHCTVYVTETGQVAVKNDVTTNGIFINGIQKLNRDTEICLNINDIIGIGCDTSMEEIRDEGCFIFKLNKNKTEEAYEVIFLEDSDEEEENKIQEQYSQFNISELKQEYMECEDIMEEYSNSMRNEDVTVECLPMRNESTEEPKDVSPVECSPSVHQLEKVEDIEDVFEEIIANANKSYAEKRVDEPMPSNDTSSSDGNVRSKKTRKKENKRRTKEETKTETRKPKRESSNRKSEHKTTRKKSTATKDESKETKPTENPTRVDHPPAVRIKECNVKISLTNIRPSCKVSEPSNAEKVSLNNESTPAVHAKITKRRNTFVPSSTLSSGSTKRQLEIINAPYMMKRRKSVSAMPEASKPSPKAKDVPNNNWLSKKVQFTRRSKDAKDEIKLKLAALVPKEKVVEPKPIRTNTKIPVKNTTRTRSDQLTDTIVKTMIPSVSKHKMIDSALPAIVCKKVRMTEYDILNDRPVRPKSPPIPRIRTETKIAEPKRIVFPEFVHTDSASIRRPSLSSISSASFASLSPAASSKKSTAPEKSILKRPAEVQQKEVSEAVPNDIQPDDFPSIALNGDTSSAVPPTSAPPSPASTTAASAAMKPTLDKANSIRMRRFTIAPSTPAPPTTGGVVKSILKKTNSIQKRRVTVTFAEDTSIKPAVTIAKPVTPADRGEEENCDDVIFNIMSLGMCALKSSSNATINGKNFSYKTVAHEYESLRHLQNVFIPLMKAELWKEIEDGYARLKNTPATNVRMNFCTKDENYPNRFKYHCETQSLAAIQNGALILMLGVNSGKESLGYIVNRQVTNKICYFQFVTPCSYLEAGCTATPLKLKQIMYIRPNLKVFEALFKLRSSPLIEHILQPRYNCAKPPKHQFTYKGYNSLNSDQMITLSTVYRKCIGGKPFISLIEGPPGTGKTRLITNLVLQLLYGKEMTQPLKILVCAPSNAAVDILTKNLSDARRKYLIEKGQKKMKLVRFGVLEKMDWSVRCVSLQELTKENNAKTVLIEQNKLMELKKKKETELAYYTTKNDRQKMSAARNEIGMLDDKIKNVVFDEKCLLEGANVICTTLNSCCALSSKISSMDICIIDEATQCNEPASLIPLQFGVKSLILVGDTKQLPSTVVSEIAKQYNYDQSLFQRLQKSFESVSEFDNPVLQLTTQYRMHPEILHWPNEYFYKNCLVSAESTSKANSKLKPYTVFNLDYVQTAHSGQKHISNVDEAKFVRNLLDFLITKADPKMYTYGIISAYSQQKDDLAKNLSIAYPFVTVNTIDSCQGQERDIVIISIARTRGIGFLAIRQRLNVALTRAKKMLILCGNFSSLQSHPMWTSLLDDAKQRKLYVHLPTMDACSLTSYFEKTLVT